MFSCNFLYTISFYAGLMSERASARRWDPVGVRGYVNRADHHRNPQSTAKVRLDRSAPVSTSRPVPMGAAGSIPGNPARVVGGRWAVLVPAPRSGAYALPPCRPYGYTGPGILRATWQPADTR